MSSQPGTQGPPSGASGQDGPPYAPRNAGLGGSPTTIPDVPIAAVLLVLYLIFGVIHIKIFKANKGRGHKFIFNGALLGLCKIRIVTMVLRIAWANYPRNVGLAIAANVFVYAGTIILYMVNWFFVQRIVRAQHASVGWSTPYRIFHRGGLVVLILSLLMLIISQIWQFFTLDQSKLDVFHIMFLVAQTYFTVFCFAPALLVLISVLIPRTEVEKFGAGRLRNNITILLISVSVLSIGQVFRCVLAWIPATAMVDVQRGTIGLPWYLSKAAFYCFNFATEIFVIVMFAVVRVDLRFYVPNGSKKPGDYSRSRVDLHNESEKNLPAPETAPETAPGPMIHQNNSSQTLHRYHSSVFEDTQTLADSLRYPSSTLEVDEKTGNWKVKRASLDSARSRHTTTSFAGSSRTTLHDRNTLVDDDAPPVPELPSEWPLPDAAPPRGSNGVLEHTNPPSRRTTPQQTYELAGHQLNDADVGDAVTDALAKLEMNGRKNTETSTLKSITPPPQYHRKSPVSVYKPTRSSASSSHRSSRHSGKRPSLPAADSNWGAPGTRTSATSSTSPREETHDPSPTSNPDITAMLNRTRFLDETFPYPRISGVSSSQHNKDNQENDDNEGGIITPYSETRLSRHASSSVGSSSQSGTSSSDAREKELAKEEFGRFSSEAPRESR